MDRLLRGLGMAVVIVLVIIGFFHLIGVNVQTGSNYVGVTYTPGCNCDGRGITPADKAFVYSVYK